MNDTGDVCGLVRCLIPIDCGLQRFGGETAAVCARCERPAGFGSVFERRSDIAFEIGQSDFADELAGGSFFDEPEAITEPIPMSGVTQQPSPYFLAREGASADVFGDRRIAPHCRAGIEIFRAVGAQS